MAFDLHTHSDLSDGTTSPAEVVSEAARAGLHGVAITDHDTTAGWEAAEEAAAEHQIALVRGMELSTVSANGIRSEERRVGKECRCRWEAEQWRRRRD